MLKEMHHSQRRSASSLGDHEYADVMRVPPRFSSVARHKGLIFRAVALFASLAILFSLIRHDSYTAITKLQIDNKSIQLGRQDAVFARSEVDVPLIQNQIELLRSGTIADQIIERFRLANDPEFGARQGLFTSWLPAAQTPEDRRRTAIESFERRLYVGRVGDSYTLEIRFTAAKPGQAADIANQIGSDYTKMLEETNADVARSASLWLQSRVRDMGPKASVITAASPPIRKDGPGSLAILFAAIIAGLMLGVTCAFAADVMDRTVRTPNQVNAVTNAECFGVIPVWKERDPVLLALRQPTSHMAHTIRRALAAIREQSDMKVVGVISMLPGEGKTIVAANLAHLAAAGGSQVLLVDAAIYSGQLSRLLARDATGGLSEVLEKKAAFVDVLWSLSGTNVKFLPRGDSARSGSHQSIGSAGFENMLSDAAFDMVVVDLPPVTLVADVREIASSFDGFVLVVEWGKTSLDVVEAALASNDQIHRKLLGVILSKVDIGKLRTYDRALSSLYDQKKNATYFGKNDSTGFFWRIARIGEKRVKLTS